MADATTATTTTTTTTTTECVISGMTCGGCVLRASAGHALLEDAQSPLTGVMEDVLAIDWSHETGDVAGRAPMMPRALGKLPEERVLESAHLQMIRVPRVAQLDMICAPATGEETPVEREQVLGRIYEAAGIMDEDELRAVGKDFVVKLIRGYLRSEGALLKYPAKGRSSTAAAATATADEYLPGHGIRDPLLRGIVNAMFAWKEFDQAQTIQWRLRKKWLERDMARVAEDPSPEARVELQEAREACYGHVFEELVASRATAEDEHELAALQDAEARGAIYYIGFQDHCEARAIESFVTDWKCELIDAALGTFPLGSFRLTLYGVRARFAYYLARTVMGGYSGWSTSAPHGAKWVADTFKKVPTPAAELAPSELRDTGLPSLDARSAVFRQFATYDTLFGYNPDHRSTRPHSKTTVYARTPLNHRYAFSWAPRFVPTADDIMPFIACACARVFASAVTLDHVSRAREFRASDAEPEHGTAGVLPLAAQCEQAWRENYTLDWLFRCGLASSLVTAGRVTETLRSGATEWAAFVAAIADWCRIGEVRKYTGAYVSRPRTMMFERTDDVVCVASLERDFTRSPETGADRRVMDITVLDVTSYETLYTTAQRAGNMLYRAAREYRPAYMSPNLGIIQSVQSIKSTVYRNKSRQRVEKKFSAENMKTRKLMRAKPTVQVTIKGEPRVVERADLVEVPDLSKWTRKGVDMINMPPPPLPAASSSSSSPPPPKKRKLVDGRLDSFVKKT